MENRDLEKEFLSEKDHSSDLLDEKFKMLLESELPLSTQKQKQSPAKQRSTSNMNFHKLKNELYVQLTNDDIFEYFEEVIEKLGSEKKNLNEFLETLSSYREYKEAFEHEVDDYSFIALRRLRLFSELSRLRLKPLSRDERRYARSLHKINLSSANFIGQTVLNNNINKNIVIWAKTNNDQKLKNNKLIKPEVKEQEFVFLLFYKKGSNYPYSEIHPIKDSMLENYDPTNITKILDAETNEKLEDYYMVNFWDCYEFLKEGLLFNNIEEINVTKLIDVRRPQDRLKFLRTYYCGFSQTQLANLMMTNFGVKLNQKNIEYWEKSKSEIPPFFKDDLIEQLATIFVDHAFDFTQLELNNGNEPPLSRKELIRRTALNIKKFPNEENPAEFDNHLHKLNQVKNPKTPMASYNDAVRRYGLEERMNKKRVLQLNNVTEEKMRDWFFVFANTKEFELLQDLSLVYSNDKTRAKVYNLWRKFVTNILYPKNTNMFNS